MALTTFLGLHRIPDDSDYRPSVTSEVKRRLCANVFYIDKIIATFTGRPPLLSGRYISTPLPLDVAEEVLMGDRQALLEAARRIKDTGGCPYGGNEIRSITMLRARTKFAYIRDEILDLALSYKPAGLLSRLR